MRGSLSTLLGSYANKSLLAQKVSQRALLWLAALLLAMGAIGVFNMLNSIGFVLPMMLVVMSFGIAIPNVLSLALVDYKQQMGSAGALLGLMYYLLIGGGLALAGIVQHLGLVLVICSIATICATFLRSHQ